MTFTCVKAGLNAAAREAAKAPTEGSYQFAYFKIISDGHHSSYEVDFKSNYMGEPDLKGPRRYLLPTRMGPKNDDAFHNPDRHCVAIRGDGGP